MPSRAPRRRLSMTSLIDIIFLLLLFFMLSSTFSRFAEVDLVSAGAGGSAADRKPVFITLAMDRITLNGASASIADLPAALTEISRDDAGPLPVYLAPKADVTSQRLTDLLAVLRGLPDLDITVLEG